MMREIKTILAPVDFSAGSAWALDYAQMVAKRFGAAIHLVHICEVPSMATASMDAYAIAYSDFSQRLGDEAEHQLAGIAAGIQDIRTSTEILFGNPARCIVTAANTNNADLIVMGTHGHGAIAHVVMGNVAERVVRTAPCPVLTVREPKAAEWHKANPRPAQMIAALVMAVLLTPWLAIGATAQEVTPPQTPAAVVTDAGTETRQRVTGRATFSLYCATCHGTTARGDGPLASNMRRKPSDLTEIAKRNGGLFPSDMVFRTIDGRQPVRGHGGADMPVWGDTFMKSREGGDANAVRETIESLVRYLESLQNRPVH